MLSVSVCNIFVVCCLVCKCTRTVQADSDSDSESWCQLAQSWRKECPLFNSAGAYSGGRLQRVDAVNRSQTVYRNDFLIPVSYSVRHWHAVTISSFMYLLFKLTYLL